MRLVYWETSTDCGYVSNLKDIRSAIGLKKHDRLTDEVWSQPVEIPTDKQGLIEALNKAIIKGRSYE
jgi:hypothetical protein